MNKQSRLDLFRYGIISPLIYDNKQKVRDFCAQAAEKQYFYNGKNYKFSEDTIRKWYYKYLNTGFDSLNKKIRVDNKESRKLNEEVIAYILDLKSKYPHITTKSIYYKLKEDKYISSDIKIDCFYRYIKAKDLTKLQLTKQERRRFEKQFPNDCWQADTSYGPYIVVDGKKYRTYLIHFIDDNSRLIVGYGFFFHDSAINVQKVFKKAIKKYGKPKQIYLDNGKSYKNNQLEIICARLGVKLTHTHAYDPEAKGKVERCFRTIKEGWMYCSDWNKYNSLDELEKDYSNYLYNNYINKIHSELKDTPNNVWHNGIENTIYKTYDEEELNKIFMLTDKRKVNKDRTIVFNNRLYEVPFKYVGTTVEIRYNADDINDLWIFEDNKQQEKCKLLNKKDNAKVVRKSNIDYEKIINKEEDVIDMGDE